MTVGDDVLYFANGSVKFNNVPYYYVTNLQGDVIAILNPSGGVVVQYTYDAWGNVLSTTGSMASTLGTLNPIRYRGYVYDQESGLYYLQSRYYDPEVGRFINADALVSTGQGLLGNNMFAYCDNNPVIYYDPFGNCACLAGKFSSDYAYSCICSCSGSGWAAGEKRNTLFDTIGKAIDYVMNTDEQVALDAEHFAFYKGQLVIKEDWRFTKGRSGSFLVMFLNSNETDPNIVKHERGHLTQLIIMGVPNYVFSVAIPSVLSDPNNPNYYSNPWERTADWLGDVNREDGYTTGSLAWGIYQIIAGPISVPLYLVFGG
jgi:RHS repeat-associated protein